MAHAAPTVQPFNRTNATVYVVRFVFWHVEVGRPLASSYRHDGALFDFAMFSDLLVPIVVNERIHLETAQPGVAGHRELVGLAPVVDRLALVCAGASGKIADVRSLFGIGLSRSSGCLPAHFVCRLPPAASNVRCPSDGIRNKPMSGQTNCVSRRVFWFLPLVFVIHDSEELVTMPGWIAEHHAMLEALAERSDLAATLVTAAPATSARAAVAIGTVFAVLLLVTVGATVARGRAWLYAYTGFLGLLFLHVFTHFAQALYFWAYVPGVVSAVFVVLPATLFLYRSLFAYRILNWQTAILSALGGFALFVPGAFAAWSVGRLVAG